MSYHHGEKVSKEAGQHGPGERQCKAVTEKSLRVSWFVVVAVFKKYNRYSLIPFIRSAEGRKKTKGGEI